MSDTQQAAGQGTTATPAQGDGQAQGAAAPSQQLTLLEQGAQQGGEGNGNAETTQQGQPDGKQSTDGDGKPDDDKSKGEGDDQNKDGKQDGPPEKYELKAPEGFEQLDPHLVESFEPLARELNLTNEGAQKLVETMMPKVVERITEQHREAWNAQIEAWVSDVKADKELGGEALPANVKAAERALSRFGTPELKALLQFPSAENPRGLGLGNHPEVVRLLSKIGKSMAEDTLATGNGAGGDKKSAAEILYGNPSAQ